MEQQDGNKVMAFDTLFSTNHIAMLKILLSCLDYQAQKSMAVYIKFLELQYTIHYYNQNPHPCLLYTSLSYITVRKSGARLL